MHRSRARGADDREYCEGGVRQPDRHGRRILQLHYRCSSCFVVEFARKMTVCEDYSQTEALSGESFIHDTRHGEVFQVRLTCETADMKWSAKSFACCVQGEFF